MCLDRRFALMVILLVGGLFGCSEEECRRTCGVQGLEFGSFEPTTQVCTCEREDVVVSFQGCQTAVDCTASCETGDIVSCNTDHACVCEHEVPRWTEQGCRDYCDQDGRWFGHFDQERQVCNCTTYIETYVCGNFGIEANEQCDDGNTVDGDGCSDGCRTEYGFVCDGNPSVCHSTCGDGLRAEIEDCTSCPEDAGVCPVSALHPSTLGVKTVNTVAGFTIRDSQNGVVVWARGSVVLLSIEPGEYIIQPEDETGFMIPVAQRIVLEPNTSMFQSLVYMPENHPMISQMYRNNVLVNGSNPLYGITVSARPNHSISLRKLIFRDRSYGSGTVFGYGLMDRDMNEISWVSVGSTIDITELSTVTIDLGNSAVLENGASASFHLLGLLSNVSYGSTVITEFVGLEWSDENGIYVYDVEYQTGRIVGTQDVVTAL